jgi:hypothetical protein
MSSKVTSINIADRQLETENELFPEIYLPVLSSDF